MSLTLNPSSNPTAFSPEKYGTAYNPYSASERINVSSTALYMSNLPHQVQPHHLARIFAEPYPKGGKRGRERDAGITMIQIYTIPRNPTAALSSSPSSDTSSTKSSKWSLSTSLKRVLSPSAPAPQGTARSVRSNSSSSSNTQRPHSVAPSRPTASIPASAPPAGQRRGDSVTVHVEGVDEDHESEDEDDGRASIATVDNDEDSITIAYVHFETDMHLIRARKTLSEITIGGREISYETKYIDRNVGKRFWAWWTRAGQYGLEE